MAEKTVLIVHNYYQIPGGEDTVVANEKKMLENHGHKVVVYSRHNSELNKMPKIKKLLLPFSTVFNLRTYREVKQLIRLEQIDVVHVHNTLNLISPSVYYAARKMKKPVVQTIHNFRFLCPGATFYRDGKICEECVSSGLKNSVKYSCYRNSKIQTLACAMNTAIHRKTGILKYINFICLTEFNKQKLLELKQLNEGQVYVKPNFALRAAEYVPAEKRTPAIVYAGRLDYLKGVDKLLSAWKELGDEAPELLLCGSGPLEEFCKKYIEENGLRKVKYMGVIANDRMQKIMSSCSALILPTQWYEGFPMTIAEAYSTGTPVIGSAIGNVGSLIENNRTGVLIRDNDIQKAVKAFQQLPLDVLVTGAYAYYQKNLTEQENYKKLKEIYGRISR